MTTYSSQITVNKKLHILLPCNCQNAICGHTFVHSKSIQSTHCKALYIVRQRSYNDMEKTPRVPHKHAVGDSRKEKLFFDGKNPTL